MNAATELMRTPTVLKSLSTPPEVELPRPGEPASLWLVDVTHHADVLDELSARVLDENERRQVDAFRVDDARRLYQAAHIALRLLLGTCLGREPAAVELTREPCPCCDKQHGRPAVVGGGLHFSLSHSGQVALLALAATPVGVDVELGPKPESVEGLAEHLHPRETKELSALPQQQKVKAFARVWARKEAYLKGIGTGLGRDLAADYVGSGPTPPPGPDGWHIADVAVAGYAAAVATAP